jgi:hypothetical protein
MELPPVGFDTFFGLWDDDGESDEPERAISAKFAANCPQLRADLLGTRSRRWIEPA